MAPTAATPILRELHHVQYTPPELPSSNTVSPMHTPRFGTLEQMAAARKRSQRPHHSYALNKPQHDMTQRDFFLARKFDQDGKGFLTEQEQAAAKRALSEGYGKDHYSDYYSHKPQTRFQKTLASTLPFAPTTYVDTFNRCLTEFEDRHGSPVPDNTTLTRTKLLHKRTVTEQEELAKKIQKGWTESINRLRPKQTGAEKTPRSREGYVEKPKHKTRTEILQSRQEKRRPKDGYDWDDTLGISAREYFIASLFDKGHKLDLSAEERKQLQDAVNAGLGQDSMTTYYSHKQTPPDSRVARVLRHTFKQDARRLEDSFNRTIGNECGGFEERNDEATWITTVQELHGISGDKAESPLEAWRRAGKPMQQSIQKRKFEPKAPTTDQYGFHVGGEYDTGTYRVTAEETEDAAQNQAGAGAVTDRTHHRPSRKPSPPLSARVRPSTSDGMRNRYQDWNPPTSRPVSQGRAAGLPLNRNKGQGCLNMFWPMPPRRS